MSVPQELAVHLVIDNYATHKSPLIRNGLVKRPRFHVHFTPTYGSWMNLVERWFGLFTQRQIKRRQALGDEGDGGDHGRGDEAA